MKISVITPWKNGLDLLSDYAAAVQGAEVVTVDNGSDPETAQALAQAGGVLNHVVAERVHAAGVHG